MVMSCYTFEDRHLKDTILVFSNFPRASIKAALMVFALSLQNSLMINCGDPLGMGGIGLVKRRWRRRMRKNIQIPSYPLELTPITIDIFLRRLLYWAGVFSSWPSIYPFFRLLPDTNVYFINEHLLSLLLLWWSNKICANYGQNFGILREMLWASWWGCEYVHFLADCVVWPG